MKVTFMQRNVEINVKMQENKSNKVSTIIVKGINAIC